MFSKTLDMAFADADANDPRWAEFYRSPAFQEWVGHYVMAVGSPVKDLDLQFAGIDRYITSYGHVKRFGVDEKVIRYDRLRSWRGEETLFVECRNTNGKPSWAADPDLATDIILYSMPSAARWFAAWHKPLVHAVRANAHAWRDEGCPPMVGGDGARWTYGLFVPMSWLPFTELS